MSSSAVAGVPYVDVKLLYCLLKYIFIFRYKLYEIKKLIIELICLSVKMFLTRCQFICIKLIIIQLILVLFLKLFDQELI